MRGRHRLSSVPLGDRARDAVMLLVRRRGRATAGTCAGAMRSLPSVDAPPPSSPETLRHRERTPGMDRAGRTGTRWAASSAGPIRPRPTWWLSAWPAISACDRWGKHLATSSTRTMPKVTAVPRSTQSSARPLIRLGSPSARRCHSGDRSGPAGRPVHDDGAASGDVASAIAHGCVHALERLPIPQGCTRKVALLVQCPTDSPICLPLT